MPLAVGDLLGCIHPVARLTGLALLAVGLVCVLVAAVFRRRICWPLVAACIALSLSAVWLGALRYSPLGFGTARLPLLSRFEIRRVNRVPITLASGEVVSVTAGSPVQIYPEILPGPVVCLWSASAGGALDDPRSCDTVYVAAQGVPFETLRLRLRSACGLAPAVVQIKISILP